jgi:hypothetical protein
VRATDGRGLDVDFTMVMAGFDFETVFAERRALHGVEADEPGVVAGEERLPIDRFGYRGERGKPCARHDREGERAHGHGVPSYPAFWSGSPRA